MTSSRLAAPFGRQIDRTRQLSFEFNGRRLVGFAGDTLASALLANDVRLVGRSFKLHRPRGIFSCGVEEPSGLVDVGVGARRTPNQRATLIELVDGLTAVSINCWPSVGFDVSAINDTLSGLLSAGFYYKTFKWPNWHLFEPTIRRMAGLGRASTEPDPDRYDEVSTSADVLVIGAGLAGLRAAVSAAEAGADTLLVTSGTGLGGALAWRGSTAGSAVLELVAAAKTPRHPGPDPDHGVRRVRSRLRVRAGGRVLRRECSREPAGNPARAPVEDSRAQHRGGSRWLRTAHAGSRTTIGPA